MASELDLAWLEEQAPDKETRLRLHEIAEWQRRALALNELPDDPTPIALRLADYELWMEAGGAFCALELFQEIFRDNSHCAAPGFDARDAELVVDLGANHGFYALKLQRQNPRCRMLCVEPNPYVFPLLSKNMRVNGFCNAVLVDKAAAASEGVIELDLIRQIHAIAGRALRDVPRAWMREDFIESVRVGSVTLTQLLAEYGLSTVDILKVDVEGMELDILRSAQDILASVAKMVVERHSRRTRDAIVSLLTECGFDLILDEDPTCQRYYGDLYFVNQNLAA